MLEKCPTRIPSFSLLLFPHFLSHASLSNRSLLRSSSLNFKDHIYSLPNKLIQSMPCFPPITVLFFYLSVNNPHMTQSHNSSLSLSKLCNQSYKLVLWPALSFSKKALARRKWKILFTLTLPIKIKMEAISSSPTRTTAFFLAIPGTRVILSLSNQNFSKA